MPTRAQQAEAAIRHLRKSDPVIAAVIKRVGPFTLKPDRDRFRMLMRSIVSQQISTKAARSIRGRLEALVEPETPTAQNLAVLSVEQLRSAGLSAQKASYMHDLAEKVAGGQVKLNTIGRLSDEAVIDELTQIRGIGRWTAQMFLIFSLGRWDVFPHDDLGVRAAIRRLYGLDDLPDKATSHAIAEPWRPFATVASWYCWRSLENDGVA